MSLFNQAKPGTFRLHACAERCHKRVTCSNDIRGSSYRKNLFRSCGIQSWVSSVPKQVGYHCIIMYVKRIMYFKNFNDGCGVLVNVHWLSMRLPKTAESREAGMMVMLMVAIL